MSTGFAPNVLGYASNIKHEGSMKVKQLAIARYEHRRGCQAQLNLIVDRGMSFQTQLI